MTREHILRFVAPVASSTAIAIIVMGIGGGDPAYSATAYMISHVGLLLTLGINFAVLAFPHHVRVVLRAIREVTAEELLAIAAVLIIVQGIVMIMISSGDIKP